MLIPVSHVVRGGANGWSGLASRWHCSATRHPSRVWPSRPRHHVVCRRRRDHGASAAAMTSAGLLQLSTTTPAASPLHFHTCDLPPSSPFSPSFWHSTSTRTTLCLSVKTCSTLKRNSHAANLTLSIETDCYWNSLLICDRDYTKFFFDNDKEAITSRLHEIESYLIWARNIEQWWNDLSV